MQIFTSFGIQPVLLLAQIVNFLIILFVLRRFFYKPITKALEERRQKIAESLTNAQLIEKKLTETEENSAKILEEARNIAQSVITEAKKESQRISDQTNLDARKTIEDALLSAKSQIEKQKDEMKKEIEHETLILVSHVTKKVLGRSLKQDEKQQLTSKSIAEIIGNINE